MDTTTIKSKAAGIIGVSNIVGKNNAKKQRIRTIEIAIDKRIFIIIVLPSYQNTTGRIPLYTYYIFSTVF